MAAEQAEESKLKRFVAAIQRANAIAVSTTPEALLDQMLALIIEVTEAEAGTLYLYDAASDELVFRVVHGDEASRALVGTRFPSSRGVAGRALREGRPLFINDVRNDPSWDRSLGELSTLGLRTMYCLPLILRGTPAGVVQIFNPSFHTIDEPDELPLLELLGNRLITEVEKARLLEDAQRRERRQSALVDIISRITSTLDRDQLLDRIMNHARDLLDVEATSIWVQDEHTRELVLHIATGERREHLREVRVPSGQGIIGYVASTGERVFANDVRTDPRFYGGVDEASGFVTRSIVCVPLRAPAIELGEGRGSLQEAIVGGAQALNKRNDAPFTEEDAELFETLASQAATVLRLSRLYDETSDMFLGIVDAVAGAVDLRDPDTAGHSQRVSDFSVAISRELGLSAEEIYRVRISGILHDVGKIGIPDAILTKAGGLSEEEWAVMRSHTTKGAEMLLKNARLARRLHYAVPALAEHHERLDGRGYPNHLRGDAISLLGRIVAVADAFDAMTADRRYRPGRSVDEALRVLREAAGTEFDAACVKALIAAREKGAIEVQRERTTNAE
jgi:HD-GYP domain-containing protein (c-di-GMP phosphodiesterase class II)